MCPGSDKSSGGAHGVLRTEVDIVLLLPVDPVGPWALSATREKIHKIHFALTSPGLYSEGFSCILCSSRVGPL